MYQYDRSIGSGEGITLYTKAVWNKHSSESDTDFVEYLVSISNKIDYWNVDEYYVTLPDIVKLDPGGFDDYIIYESSGDKKTTTIRSLPIDFVAPFFLSQTPAGNDSAESPTLWFHTAHQTISARVIDMIAAGGTHSSGSRLASLGIAQIVDNVLKIPGGGSINYYQAVVTVLNAQTDVLPSGSLVYLTWVDDVVAGSAWQGWAVTKAKPIICSERLERFTMLSGWQYLKTTASFMLITAGSPDQYGILEDPLGIFTDQIGYDHSGLSIRTCDGRHFVIQAKCNQTTVTPPVLGMCLIGSAGNSTCANTTEANCTLLGGVWTAGVSCP